MKTIQAHSSPLLLFNPSSMHANSNDQLELQMLSFILNQMQSYDPDRDRKYERQIAYLTRLLTRSQCRIAELEREKEKMGEEIKFLYHQLTQSQTEIDQNRETIQNMMAEIKQNVDALAKYSTNRTEDGGMNEFGPKRLQDTQTHGDISSIVTEVKSYNHKIIQAENRLRL